MLCAVVVSTPSWYFSLMGFFFFLCGEERGLGRMVLVCDLAGAMIRLPNLIHILHQRMCLFVYLLVAVGGAH